MPKNDKLDKSKQKQQKGSGKDKKKKKQQKQQIERQQRQQRQRQQKQMLDRQVDIIYRSGLASGYKYFLQQAFKDNGKHNIYQLAAQKILKYEKLIKQKKMKLSSLQ